MKKVALIFGLGAIVFTLTLCTQSQETHEHEGENHSSILLETMGYYQRFSHKLWLAGKNQNWELADFYTHELEEVTEKLIAGDIMHDGYNLSNLSGSLLMPKIEKLEEAIRVKDEVLFLDNYKLMVGSCNLCHQTTKHSFIKVTVPHDSTVWNQDF